MKGIPIHFRDAGMCATLVDMFGDWESVQSFVEDEIANVMVTRGWEFLADDDRRVVEMRRRMEAHGQAWSTGSDSTRPPPNEVGVAR